MRIHVCESFYVMWGGGGGEGLCQICKLLRIFRWTVRWLVGWMVGWTVVWSSTLYSLCTDNDLQSLLYYFIIACIEFSGERRGGRWVDYLVAGGVDAYRKHILCTDNDDL